MEAKPMEAGSIPRPAFPKPWRILSSLALGWFFACGRGIVAALLAFSLNWGFLAMLDVRVIIANAQDRRMLLVYAGLLGIIFPLLYLVSGQSHGIQMAFRDFYIRNKTFVLDLLFWTLAKVGSKVPPGSGRGWSTLLARETDLPFGLRLLIRHYLGKDSLSRILAQIVTHERLDAQTESATREKYRAELDACLLSSVFHAEPKWLWTCFALNLTCMIAVCWQLQRV